MPLPNSSRRAFLTTAAAGLAWSTMGPRTAKAEEAGGNSKTWHEPARDIPLTADCDVIVCGGGPAGIAAALSAARAGAKVRLFECHGCLGGVWTSGMLSFVIDAKKPGLNAELSARLDALGGRWDNQRNPEGGNYVYDVETMKYVLEDLFLQAGIDFHLHSRVVAVGKNEQNRVKAILTESKSGRQAWAAPVFIDATGDGDVGALAGCDWQFGEDETCPCQPMSLMGIISASPEAIEKYDTSLSSAHKDELREEMIKAGVEPSYSKPTVWNWGNGIAAVMLNHEYGVKPFDVKEVTDATVNARRELFHIIQTLKKQGGQWKDARLISTAEQIGVRDGRRIKGLYEVNVDDVRTGSRHLDSICRSTFCVDIHAPTREQNRKSAYSSSGVKAKPFDIPLRALIAAQVDGLMLAGRCISGDFFAHASYRVTGNAVAMGEAAGVTAALAATSDVLPQHVPWPAVSQALEQLRKEADQLARAQTAS